MDDVDKNTITEISGDSNYWQNGLKWSFITVDENNGALYFHDEKLIFLFTNYANKLMLSKVISKFGNPDKVYATRMVLDGTMVTYNLYYSSGVCVEVNTMRIKPKEVESKKGQYSAQIRPSERIKYIYYFDNNLTADELNTTCFWQYDQEKIQVWKGYGDYSFFTE